MRQERDQGQRIINPAAMETTLGIGGLAGVSFYAENYEEIKDSDANMVNEQVFDALDRVGVSPQESFAFTLGIFAAFTAHGITRLIRQRRNLNRPEE